MAALLLSSSIAASRAFLFLVSGGVVKAGETVASREICVDAKKRGPWDLFFSGQHTRHSSPKTKTVLGDDSS